MSSGWTGVRGGRGVSAKPLHNFCPTTIFNYYSFANVRMFRNPHGHPVHPSRITAVRWFSKNQKYWNRGWGLEPTVFTDDNDGCSTHRGMAWFVRLLVGTPTIDRRRRRRLFDGLVTDVVRYNRRHLYRQPPTLSERFTAASHDFTTVPTPTSTVTDEHVSAALGVVCGCVYVRDDYAV